MVNVTFETTPVVGAELFIDGENTFKVTPATLDILGNVQHTYMLRADGFEDFNGTITVTEGNMYVVQVGLILDYNPVVQFYDKLVLIGWASLGVAVAGIVIGAAVARNKKGR